MLNYGDKTIYIEGVLIEIGEDFARMDVKGRLGCIKLPLWMYVHDHPMMVGQEFGWDMSFPEQLGPKAAPATFPPFSFAREGMVLTIEGKVNRKDDCAAGIEFVNCKGDFVFPMRMFLCDYEIVEGQPVGFCMTPPKQLRAEPNTKYVSNLDTYLRRQAEMQANK